MSTLCKWTLSRWTPGRTPRQAARWTLSPLPSQLNPFKVRAQPLGLHLPAKEAQAPLGWSAPHRGAVPTEA